MKIPTIIFTLLVSTALYSQEPEIYGHWKLERIETPSGVLNPKKTDYFLTITSDSLSYNLEVNKCWGPFTMTNNRISPDQIACTEMCCDGRYDSISNFINYHGLYEIEQNQLMITSNGSKLFLERLPD